MADELHPEAAEFLDALDAQPAPPTHASSPATAREALLQVAQAQEPDDVGQTTEFGIEGPGGELQLRVYVPETPGPHPTLVYYHGGGWVLGEPQVTETVCTALCSRAEMVVVAPDYRKAPEHPFPAGVEDAAATLSWAGAYADSVGGDPDRLAVGGDSAGGNLAAAMTLYARDHDGPDIDYQSLIYPAVASPAIHDFDSYDENAEGYFLERDSVEWFYDKYVDSPAHARNAYLAPLLARDHAGLPPASVVTAGFDPIRDEGIAYAERLDGAGIDVAHHHYDDMIHAFVGLSGYMKRGDEALDQLAADLRAAFD
jgi:acetyl esterase